MTLLKYLQLFHGNSGMNNEEERFGGGIIENAIDGILKKYNISRKDIDKVKSIIDKVEISHVGKSTVIEINLKKLKIVIDS